MILNLFKKIGETPLQRINRLRIDSPELVDEKMTYAGRLDPMAEGVLIVLTGEDVYKKEEYLRFDKTYDFTVLWGISSDTYDILGEITIAGGYPDDSLLSEDVNGFVGNVEIPYPAYSSRTVLGRPLWSYARAGELEEIEFPKKSMRIENLKFNGSHVMSCEELLQSVNERISILEGDFRQDLIKEKWSQEINNTSREFFKTSSYTAEVSSGTYIRSLAVKMGEKYDTRSLAWHIRRTKVGHFHIDESIV